MLWEVTSLLHREIWKGGEARRVSPGDLALLVVSILLVCTILAVEDGLFLRFPDRAAASRLGRDNILDIRGLDRDRIEIDGRAASIDMVGPAAEAALAADDRAVIVLDTGPRTGYGLVVSILEQLKHARASRVVLRERRT